MIYGISQTQQYKRISLRNLWDKIKIILMSVYLVRFCQIPEYKLKVTAKKLVWYRSPITQASLLHLNLFDTDVELSFHGVSSNICSTVQYHLPSQGQLSKFYENRLTINIVDRGQAVGFCCLQPKTLIQKPIIVPIIAYHKFEGRDVKLGDLQIAFKLQKSKVPVNELYNLKQYLDSLDNSPLEFKKMYMKLRKQKLI